MFIPTPLFHSPAPAAPIIYVNAANTGSRDGQSWETAYADLQDALQEAGDGATVWISEGLYLTQDASSKGINRHATFRIPSGVRVLGGFSGSEADEAQRDPAAHLTILGGDQLMNDDATPQSGNDNSFNVVTVANGTVGTLLDGVSIQDGQWGFNPLSDPGAGVRIVGGFFELRQCRVRQNDAGFVSGGGGGGLYAQAAQLSIVDCIFEENRGLGGAIQCVASDLFVTDSQFVNNFGGSTGGAIWLRLKSFIDITHSLFDGNAAGVGGAVYLDATAPSTTASMFRSCTFRSNSAGGSGGAIITFGVVTPAGSDAILTLSDCVLAGNVSGSPGGAVGLVTSRAQIQRCTIVSNQASSGTGGGGLSIGGSSAVDIADSVVWGNVAPMAANPAAQVLVEPFSGIVLSHTNVQDLTPELAGTGVGNLDVNPAFVDADGADEIVGTADDDLRLGIGSPLIDAGSFDEVYGLDVSGSPRWIDGNLDGKLRIDMGAHEFSNVELHVSAQGDAVTVSVLGTPGLLGMLFVGRVFGESLVVPYGSAFVDFDSGWSRLVVGPLPASFAVPASLTFGLGDGPVLQALGVRRKPLGTVGNWSNPILLGDAVSASVR